MPNVTHATIDTIVSNPQQLRARVRQVYSAVALQPSARYPFPVGRRLAENVGYPRQLLDPLPAVAVAAFAGVSNVAVFADLTVDMTLLDLGCGAGLDALIAAQRVGPNGKVIGLDFSPTMLARAQQAATTAGLAHLHFLCAAGEQLPLPDAAVDGALINGIFNLNPARALLFRELARVVRPGGVVYGAEIILRAPLSDTARQNATNWFA